MLICGLDGKDPTYENILEYYRRIDADLGLIMDYDAATKGALRLFA